MSIVEALRGAQVQFRCTQAWVPRLRCIQRIAKVMAAEAMWTLSMVGYGARAIWMRNNLDFVLPLFHQRASLPRITSARYGSRARNLIDIYHPSSEAMCKSECYPESFKDRDSIVLFVHGGVWSSGERWHYSPLARKLCGNEVTACVMSYTLYPEASASDIAGEINKALDWIFEKLEQNSKTKVTLVGHSSGAHTAMVAVQERLKKAKRMPDQVIGMCGVYDIEQHYHYEKSRGVHEISTMKRAMGGFQNFHNLSPTLSLPNILSPDSTQKLPKIVLMTSKADHVAPSVQSKELHEVLQQLGCKSIFLEYRDISHSHFATKCWLSDYTRSTSFVSDFISLVRSPQQTNHLVQGLAVNEAVQPQTEGVGVNFPVAGVSS